MSARPAVLTDGPPPAAAEPDPRALAAEGVRRTHRRARRRGTVVVAVLVGLLTVLAVLALVVDQTRLTPLEAVRTALWLDDEGRFAVRVLRLPRLLEGLLVGLGLGAAGALFQSVLRNPLASPDVIGVTQGASVGAVTAVLLLGTTGALLPLMALAGGVVVGAVLYLVSWRAGLSGHRFVLSGIGVAYLATSFTGYVFTRAQVRDAQVALQWLSGNLAQASWEAVAQLALALAVLLPLTAAVGARLEVLLLGDDASRALGLRTERVRLAVVALGVLLASFATAAAGPVAFVALVAAPVARRLRRDGTAALLTSALVGGVLVVTADLVAQYVLRLDQPVPVGIVTGVIGGPYLIWLLATRRRTTEDR
ncbi:iron chelate uptake ABC transporter family permease subunit [Angustibacter speluncae]